MSKPLAIVTGASKGIGRSIALRLAADYEILAVARSAADVSALADEIATAGGTCRAVMLDLRDPSAVTAALNGIEAQVLVNNAGVGSLKPMLELSRDEWLEMVDVNFNALFDVTRAVLPGMVARGTGHVVFIGSIAGRSAFVGGTCYAATKHAVIALAESLMLEVRDAGVKVSVVSPGSVDTGFGGSAGASWKLSADDVAVAVANVVATPPNVLVHRVEVRTLTVPKKK